MQRIKNIAILALVPVALCFVGIGWTLMTLGIPVVNDATQIIKNSSKNG